MFVDGEGGRICQEAELSRICPEEQDMTKKIHRDRRYLSRESNPGPPNYKAAVQTIRFIISQKRFVKVLWEILFVSLFNDALSTNRYGKWNKCLQDELCLCLK
jgi:hypothetical protein